MFLIALISVLSTKFVLETNNLILSGPEITCYSIQCVIDIFSDVVRMVVKGQSVNVLHCVFNRFIYCISGSTIVM